MPTPVSQTIPQAHRPDPAQGVFETLLVLDGRPVELDAHLARLRASLTVLYPRHTRPVLDVSVVTGTSTSALRIAVAPGPDGELAAAIERRSATGHFAPDIGGKVSIEAISLRSLTLPRGLGEHKWADRGLLDDAQVTLPDDALPLIVDEDGSVLEASRANVFVVCDGVLLTPPADGRILPGITRMRVLEIAGEAGIDVDEAELSTADLLGADEVFLTGSVRGIESAHRLDGAPLAGGGEIAGHVAAGLGALWTGAKTASEFG